MIKSHLSLIKKSQHFIFLIELKNLKLNRIEENEEGTIE